MANYLRNATVSLSVQPEALGVLHHFTVDINVSLWVHARVTKEPESAVLYLNTDVGSVVGQEIIAESVGYIATNAGQDVRFGVEKGEYTSEFALAVGVIPWYDLIKDTAYWAYYQDQSVLNADMPLYLDVNTGYYGVIHDSLLISTFGITEGDNDRTGGRYHPMYIQPYRSGHDGYIDSANPDTCHGRDNEVWLGYNGGSQLRCLFKFPLDRIQFNHVIDDVAIGFYVPDLAHITGEIAVSIHRMLKDWDSTCTWNSRKIASAAWSALLLYSRGEQVLYDGNLYTALQALNINKQPDAELDWWRNDGAATSLLWDTPGGDYDPIPVFTDVVSYEQGYHQMGITRQALIDLLEGWTLGSYPNYGVIMIPTITTPGLWVKAWSMDETGEGFAVDWTLPPFNDKDTRYHPYLAVTTHDSFTPLQTLIAENPLIVEMRVYKADYTLFASGDIPAYVLESGIPYLENFQDVTDLISEYNIQQSRLEVADNITMEVFDNETGQYSNFWNPMDVLVIYEKVSTQEGVTSPWINKGYFVIDADPEEISGDIPKLRITARSAAKYGLLTAYVGKPEADKITYNDVELTKTFENNEIYVYQHISDNGDATFNWVSLSTPTITGPCWGEWLPDVEYNTADIVISGGTYWKCKKDACLNQPPSPSSIVPGEVGADWKSTTEYKLNDVCKYSGKYWKSKQDVNTNHQPDLTDTPGSPTVWDVDVTYAEDALVTDGDAIEWRSKVADNVGHIPGIDALWVSGHSYSVNNRVRHSGQSYKCIKRTSTSEPGGSGSTAYWLTVGDAADAYWDRSIVHNDWWEVTTAPTTPTAPYPDPVPEDPDTGKGSGKGSGEKGGDWWETTEADDETRTMPLKRGLMWINFGTGQIFIEKEYFQEARGTGGLGNPAYLKIIYKRWTNPLDDFYGCNSLNVAAYEVLRDAGYHRCENSGLNYIKSLPPVMRDFVFDRVYSYYADGDPSKFLDITGNDVTPLVQQESDAPRVSQGPLIVLAKPDDCVYFSLTHENHRFNIINLVLTQPSVEGVYVWEYWNGTAWVAITQVPPATDIGYDEWLRSGSDAGACDFTSDGLVMFYEADLATWQVSCMVETLYTPVLIGAGPVDYLRMVDGKYVVDGVDLTSLIPVGCLIGNSMIGYHKVTSCTYNGTSSSVGVADTVALVPQTNISIYKIEDAVDEGLTPSDLGSFWMRVRCLSEPATPPEIHRFAGKELCVLPSDNKTNKLEMWDDKTHLEVLDDWFSKLAPPNYYLEIAEDSSVNGWYIRQKDEEDFEIINDTGIRKDRNDSQVFTRVNVRIDNANRDNTIDYAKSSNGAIAAAVGYIGPEEEGYEDMQIAWDFHDKSSPSNEWAWGDAFWTQEKAPTKLQYAIDDSMRSEWGPYYVESLVYDGKTAGKMDEAQWQYRDVIIVKLREAVRLFRIGAQIRSRLPGASFSPVFSIFYKSNDLTEGWTLGSTGLQCAFGAYETKYVDFLEQGLEDDLPMVRYIKIQIELPAHDILHYTQQKGKKGQEDVNLQRIDFSIRTIRAEGIPADEPVYAQATLGTTYPFATDADIVTLDKYRIRALNIGDKDPYLRGYADAQQLALNMLREAYRLYDPVTVQGVHPSVRIGQTVRYRNSIMGTDSHYVIEEINHKRGFDVEVKLVPYRG